MQCFTIIVSTLLAGCLGATLQSKQHNAENRIVGGELADITQYPYQVSIEINNKHVCGGSIVTRAYVVTAASCVDGKDRNNVKIRSGSNTIQSGGTLHDVTRLVLHPEYNSSISDFDIALVAVFPGFTYDHTTMPVILAVTVPHPGTIAVLSGWGQNSSEGELSSELHKVLLPVYDHSKCNQDYSQFGGITDNMMCAGLNEGGKDYCFGDVGDPLVIAGQLVGIASWSTSCGEPGLPGVYSSVPQLRDFVGKITGIF